MRRFQKIQSILSSKNLHFYCCTTVITDAAIGNSVREKFGDYRWVPLEPEFIDYPNAQFLMIGEAGDGLGKAASAEPDGKQAHETQPGEELEKMEHENEERIEALEGKFPARVSIYVVSITC